MGLTGSLMAMHNKRLELQAKGDAELERLQHSGDLEEEELVELYYALEMSKNNLTELSLQRDTQSPADRPQQKEKKKGVQSNEVAPERRAKTRELDLRLKKEQQKFKELKIKIEQLKLTKEGKSETHEREAPPTSTHQKESLKARKLRLEKLRRNQSQKENQKAVESNMTSGPKPAKPARANPLLDKLFQN